MSQSIVPFDFQGNRVRVIVDEQGEPWFVAVDVCRCLGLDNSTRAIERLDEDEKSQVIDPSVLNNNQGTGINILLNTISESGLYSLILTSRKPEAKAFKRWVTHEVLPSIRKTGSYCIPQSRPLPEVLRQEADWNRAVAELAKSYSQMYLSLGVRGPRRVLAIENAMRERHGIEMGKVAPLPGPQTADNRYAVIVEDRIITPTQIGAALGLSAIAANLLLEKHGFQVRQGKDWVPTAKGKPLSEWVDTGKRYHSGAPVTQLRRKESAILDALQAEQQQESLF
jgi:prophage antirepressor-like protein